MDCNEGKDHLKDTEVKMSSMPEFILRIAKATNPPQGGPGVMSIIIHRPYAHLEEELRKAFEGQEDVKVTVNKRNGERRTSRQLVELDRRSAGRRTPKEELVEVVISV
jgi:hypothetical protein